MSKEIIVERGTKTVYREGSKIIKQFKAGYPKSAVIKEAFNHALAEESGLNVPALLEVKNTGEGWALVIEAVEGKTMAQLMAEQPENLEALMEQFVEIQSDIHRHTCKQMGRLKDKLNAQISSLRDELDASTRYELHVRLENMKPHTKITHGDFNPTNVLIGADGKVYILDWAHAAIGNASADVLVKRPHGNFVEAVALFEPCGNVACHMSAALSEKVRQKTRGCNAVYIIVPEHADMLAPLERLFDPRCGLIHIEQGKGGGKRHIGG